MNPKIERKIGNLLALARSSAGTPEGTTAFAKAQELAIRYNVTLENVKLGGVVDDAPQSFRYSPESSRIWRASLAWAVAKYAGVRMVRAHGGDSWTVVARPADYETWKALFSRAEQEIDGEAKRYTSQRSAGRADADTFRKYAASGFEERLQSYKREAATSEQGAANAAALSNVPERSGTFALVPVGREVAVSQKLLQMFPKLGTVKVRTAGSNAAARDGYSFGRGLGVHKANIGRS